MRELMLIIRCDCCSAQLEEDQASQLVLTQGSNAYEADICDDCLDSLGMAWRAHTPPTSKSSPVRCLFQGCTKTFKSEQGRKSHMTRSHKEA